MEEMTGGIFDRYLAGEATPAEQAIAERWLLAGAVREVALASGDQPSVGEDEESRRAAVEVWRRLQRDMGG